MGSLYSRGMKRALILLAEVILSSCLCSGQTHTFPALDTNNTWTGTNTFSGSVVMGNATVTSLTVSSSVTVPFFSPATPGGASVGTSLLPFSDVFIGTVASQAFHFSGSPTAMRVVSLPDAASNTVQPSTCAGSTFVTSISSSGVLTCNGASIAGLTGTITLAQTPMTTRGDLMGAVGGATLQRIPLGATNLYLKSNGSDTVYSTLPASGTGSCAANQFVTTLSADASPTCSGATFSGLGGSLALAQTVLSTRGDILTVNASPSMVRLALGASGSYPKSNGSDLVYSTLAASGVGGCAGGQFVTTLNGDAIPTCGTVAQANVTGTLSIAQLFNSGQVLAPVSLTDNGSTISTNASLGTSFRVSALTANVTLSNPTSLVDGEVLSWEVIQNAAAAKTLAFDTLFAFGAEIPACTISTNLSSHNFITAIYNASASKLYVRGCITGY